METLFTDRIEEAPTASRSTSPPRRERRRPIATTSWPATPRRVSADAEAADHFAHALQAATTLQIPAAERARLEQTVAAHGAP
jgi:hypothetical protein